MFIRHGGKGVKCHWKDVANDCITIVISTWYEGVATLPYPLFD